MFNGWVFNGRAFRISNVFSLFCFFCFLVGDIFQGAVAVDPESMEQGDVKIEPEASASIYWQAMPMTPPDESHAPVVEDPYETIDWQYELAGESQDELADEKDRRR